MSDLNQYFEFLRSNHHTVAVIGVPHSMEEPGFAYTVGFTHLFGLPELFLYGGEDNDAETILNTLAQEIQKNPKKRWCHALKFNFDLIPMSQEQCDQYLVCATMKYGKKNFKGVKIEI